MPTQKFHIGDILSITTGVLLSPRAPDGVREILSFMTGENLCDSQMCHAAELCAPKILEKYPALRTEKTLALAGDGYEPEWLAEMVAKHGRYLEIETLDDGCYEHKNPVREISEMIANRRKL